MKFVKESPNCATYFLTHANTRDLYADFDIMNTILPSLGSGSCSLANAAVMADTISALEMVKLLGQAKRNT